MNLKLSEVKNEVQKELNEKSMMGVEIRLYGEIFGMITNFNSAIGTVQDPRFETHHLKTFLKNELLLVSFEPTS